MTPPGSLVVVRKVTHCGLSTQLSNLVTFRV
eukprot:SAG25_NODE_1748_length_2401_cov_20.010860_3_plen_30_part_01